MEIRGSADGPVFVNNINNYNLSKDILIPNDMDES